MRRLVILTLLIGLATCAGVRAQERMPPIAADKMTDAQKKAVADYKTLRGTDMTHAYASTLHLSLDVKAGLLIRQTHHWAANVFAAAIVLFLGIAPQFLVACIVAALP